MKVLLISANTNLSPYPVYPLGLDYVAQALAPSHEVRIADLNVLASCEALAELIRDFAPAIIGLSLRNVDNTDVTQSRSFAAEYRQLADLIHRHSDALLILGGAGFTIFAAQYMAALEADYGIIGEGERLALLLDALSKQQDPAKVPGVILPGSKARIPAPLAAPIRRRFRPQEDHVAYYRKHGGMLNLQTKRGCPFKCIYCTYPYIEGHKQRLIPPGEVAACAKALQEGGARFFYITDSAFNSHVGHSRDVARAFIKAGVSIPWAAFFAPIRSAADNGYFGLMAEAGLSHVEFGTEALWDPMLETYQKPFRTGDVLLAHQAALTAGLHVGHFFLLGGPGESRESLRQTLERATELEKCACFFFCGIRIYPHTPLYDLAMTRGRITGTENLLAPVFYQPRHVDTPTLVHTLQEAAKGRPNWIVGAGGDTTAQIVSKLHARGHVGPLWEHLIR